jgi:hypothetical protein
LKGLFLAILVAVELVERDDAAAVAAKEDEDVGLFDTQLVGHAPVLVDVDEVDGDAAVRPGLGGVGVFTEETLDVAVGLGDAGSVGVLGEGGDDPHGEIQGAKEGLGFGREGVLAVLAEVKAPGVVAREVVESAEKTEEEHGLQHQVDGAEPAGGAEAVGQGHGWISCAGAWPRRSGC